MLVANRTAKGQATGNAITRSHACGMDLAIECNRGIDGSDGIVFVGERRNSECESKRCSLLVQRYSFAQPSYAGGNPLNRFSQAIDNVECARILVGGLPDVDKDN